MTNIRDEFGIDKAIAQSAVTDGVLWEIEQVFRAVFVDLATSYREGG